MARTWALQDAKARFSEVVRRANADGPQVVTYRGIEKAVVLSVEDFRRLRPQRRSFVDVLLDGPMLDDRTIETINRRSRDRGRKAATTSATQP
jgi:antitoxin Phd